jgi:ribosomal protein L37E
MAACERCWRDAYDPHFGITDVDAYARLLAQRVGHLACTPEEHAGPDATRCARCLRRTVHQYAGTCMACGWRPA